MILKPEDIRKVRPVAENLNDPARLVTYIREAETLRLVDAIGADLYDWLDTGNFIGDGPYQYTRPDGDTVSITKEEYAVLMGGGYFADGRGGRGRTEGLLTAIAYTAYARFIMNNPINATAHGVVFKAGEFSTKVDDVVLVRNSNEARKIGEAYLDGVVKCLGAYGLLGCCRRKYTEVPRRIVRIKRDKL